MSRFAPALTHECYGPPDDVLRVRQIEVDAPSNGEVLVHVRASSANPADWHLVRGEPPFIRLLAGIRGPKDSLAGADVAGIVEDVGPDVTDFVPGDEVFGTANGAWAQLALAKVERLARKPERLSFEQAASLPIAGCTALQALRDHGRLRAAQRVLIVGASGGVGSFAVQIAKAFGAEVTGVCSAANLDFVRELGADSVLDYTRDDFAAQPDRYDVVLQIAGDRSLSDLRRALAPRGTLVLVGRGIGRDGKGGMVSLLGRFAAARLYSRKKGKRVATFIARIRRDDLETLAALVADSHVNPAVERTYPLAETAAALREIEGGHARGKIAISL